MTALVLGVGNVLLKDDGIGIHAAGELARRFSLGADVEVLDGGTAGIELLRYLDGKDHIIFVDAVSGGRPPGTMVRVDGEDVPRLLQARIGLHQLGLSDMLATAMTTGVLPRKTVLFGIEPKEMIPGLDLSPEVESSLTALVAAVVEELRRLGYRIVERDNPAPRRLEWRPG